MPQKVEEACKWRLIYITDKKKQKQNKIRKIYFWSYIYDGAWQINSITSRPEERNFWSLVVQPVAGWQQGEQAVACVRRSVL